MPPLKDPWWRSCSSHTPTSTAERAVTRACMQVILERALLATLNHPFVLKLVASYESQVSAPKLLIASDRF